MALEPAKPAQKRHARPAGKEPQPVVVKIGEGAAARPASNRGWALRHKLLALSFLLCFVVPATLSAAYFGAIAADRYASGAGFAVRGVNAGSGMDLVGAFTGLASTGSTTSDSYIVLEALESRDLVETLQAEFDLAGRYGDAAADRLARLPAETSIEGLVDYWSGVLHTEFDPTSGIIAFEVQAFDPDTAKALADRVLLYAQDLVNRVSEAARRDSVRFAEAEVERAEARLREALDRLRAFREREQSLNPAADAQAQVELLTGLERQLLDIRARIGTISGSVDATAPSLLALRRQAEALEGQIAERTGENAGSLGGESRAALSELLAAYETFDVEKTFAQQAYASALSSLEQARVEADRQQRYLAVFSAPSRAEEAVYPHRLRNALLLAAGFFCLWGIGALVAYSVRDHVT